MAYVSDQDLSDFIKLEASKRNAFVNMKSWWDLYERDDRICRAYVHKFDTNRVYYEHKAKIKEEQKGEIIECKTQTTQSNQDQQPSLQLL